MLILTVLMGLAYSLLYTKTEVRFEHWNGEEGFKLHWHWWLVNHYLMGFVFLWTISVPKKSLIDKDILTAYIIFDLFGFYCYLQWGWPERVDLIVTGFCMASIIFVLLRIFEYD